MPHADPVKPESAATPPSRVRVEAERTSITGPADQATSVDIEHVADRRSAKRLTTFSRAPPSWFQPVQRGGTHARHRRGAGIVSRGAKMDGDAPSRLPDGWPRRDRVPDEAWVPR